MVLLYVMSTFFGMVLNCKHHRMSGASTFFFGDAYYPGWELTNFLLTIFGSGKEQFFPMEK